MEHKKAAATAAADFLFWILFWRSIRKDSHYGRTLRDIVREARIISRLIVREARG